MRKILLISFFLAFIIFSANSYAYEISYIARDFVEVPNANASAPSVYWPGSCTLNMFLYATATNAGSYTLTHSYFSPDSTFIATNPKTRTSNIACQLQNADPITATTSLFDIYEGITRTEYTSSTIDTWLNLSYSCSPDSNDLFIYDETRRVDSYGNHPFGYGDAFTTCFAQSPAQCSNTLASDLNAVIAYINDGYFTLCGSDIRQDAEGEQFGGNSAGVSSDLSMNYYTMIPFNAESTGVVNISVFARVFYFGGAGSCGSGQKFASQYYIYDVEENTTQNLGTAFPLNVDLNLVPNKDYFLFIGSRYFCDDFNFGVLNINHNYTSYNITLDACETDFVCGNFSVCTDGVQTRTCIDQSVCNAPTRIEEQSCFDVPAHEIDLGFEAVVDIISPLIYTCQKDWTIIGCNDILDTISARFPVNWSVSADADLFTDAFRQNYIRISDVTSTVGTKSLQMNYIPPKPSEPINNGTGGTVCGNKTTGDFPFVTTGLNQSVFVSINISFPSPFIQLRLDARKCSEQLLQYDYTGDFLGINCGKRCYATNCSTEPKGNYRVGVFDAQTLEQIVEFTDVAINSWKSHILDLSNAGLVVNHNYTIIIVVNPQTETGVFDPDSHCVYFDNFRVTITERALPECTTVCEGLDLLLANQNNNICFFTEITNSPRCAPDQPTADAFQEFEDVCIGNTLHFFNNVTGLWDTTESSEFCEQLGEPADIPQTEVEAGEEIFNQILSFLGMKIFWALVICGLVFGSAFVTSSKLTDKGSWEGATILSLFALVFFMVVNWVPLEVGALIILPSALMVVNEFRKAT